MATDLFNNISNDYIQPNLAPCPDAGDSYSFEFLGKKNVGVVNGSQTLASMSFSDFSQPITSWTQEKKLIQPGEVIYIQGLTKGVTAQTQTFYTSDPSILDASVAAYYMWADVSIGIYKNFRYTLYDISAQADYENGVDIENAINLALAASGISVSISYDDVSTFVLSASSVGYQFSDTAISLHIDTSSGSTFTIGLVNNAAAAVPAFKYPNGAMLGYMIRTMFPTSITTESDKWLYINHVPDVLDLSTGTTTSVYVKNVDVGMNGSSTATTISAGDYLNYIDTNGRWEKLGSLRAWMGTEDPASSNIENLITGFYLFNPQTFPIQIDYILVN